MSHSLHVAKIHPINNFDCIGIYGWDSQEAFYDLTQLFNCSVAASNTEYLEYAEELEIHRDDVKQMIADITTHGEKYTENEEQFKELLNTMDMTEEELIHALVCIEQQSDQSNEWILVSWF